jgi:hypothetical protein
MLGGRVRPPGAMVEALVRMYCISSMARHESLHFDTRSARERKAGLSARPMNVDHPLLTHPDTYGGGNKLSQGPQNTTPLSTNISDRRGCSPRLALQCKSETPSQRPRKLVSSGTYQKFTGCIQLELEDTSRTDWRNEPAVEQWLAHLRKRGLACRSAPGW